MYRFMEIECPNCKHIFVWLEHTYKGTRYNLYRRKGYNEALESTVCPNCNMEMAVLKDKHSGINIEDSSIEVADSVHGI